MYTTIRPLLYQLDPEKAHHMAIFGLKVMQSSSVANAWMKKRLQVDHPALMSRQLGLTFTNPVGLAAGFDKHATVYPALASLGFGFVEVGSITPRPQPGNPQPRLFRLPEDQALINRMGFNSDGIEAAKQNFERLPRPAIPIGINLGKNKETPNDKAAEDYLMGLEQLYPYADYFVINISSPNTAGLRDLQSVDSLAPLLEQIIGKRDECARLSGYRRPVILKIAADAPVENIRETVETAARLQIDGIIASNTTISRDGLTSGYRQEMGGLSGRPLTDRSTALIHQVYQWTKGQILIIGSGGVFNGEDAYQKIKAGASLVQVYTGMIYEGPAIVKKINQELLELVRQDGYSIITEAVGAAHQIK